MTVPAPACAGSRNCFCRHDHPRPRLGRERGDPRPLTQPEAKPLPRFVAGALVSRSAALIAHPPRPIKRSIDDPLRAITRVLGGGVCIVARCPFCVGEEREHRAVLADWQWAKWVGARLLARYCAWASLCCRAAVSRVSGLLCHAVSHCPPSGQTALAYHIVTVVVRWGYASGSPT
jgi:hypothetical protein